LAKKYTRIALGFSSQVHKQKSTKKIEFDAGKKSNHMQRAYPWKMSKYSSQDG
jgi:hypothetical protein